MKSSAIFLLAALVSWTCAIPVMFVSYEEGEDGNPRLLECVTSEGSKQKMSYKCRVSSKNPLLKQQQSNNIPVIEILKETVTENDSGVTGVGVSDVILFPAVSSPVSEAVKYEVIPEVSKEKKNQGGCDDDEVFVAELNICMPYAPHKVDPKIAKVEDDDDSAVALIDPTHAILKVGFKKLKCPPGEIEIKDLGICAPINNCWPHPDCSHLEQQKDNTNNQSNTRVEVDKDDD